MVKSIFFSVISLLFALISFFHFSRLALEWEIVINEWFLPGWASGLAVIFGIFISYWSFKLKKFLKKDSEKLKERLNEKESDEQNF